MSPEKNLNTYSGPNWTTDKYYTTTAKIGAYKPDGSHGITYYSPMNSQVGAMHGVDNVGEWQDNAFSYIQGAPTVNYDNPGVYEDYGYVIFGTEAEANAAIAQLPGIDQSYDFDFTKENMRFFNTNCRLIKENAGWTWYLDPHVDNGQTSYLGNLMSPARAWQASGFTQLHFEIAVTGTSTLQVEFHKPGNTAQNHFFKEFSVTGDGQFRTYTVNKTDIPNFDGIISSVGLHAGSTTGSNAKVVLKHIWKN